MFMRCPKTSTTLSFARTVGAIGVVWTHRVKLGTARTMMANPGAPRAFRDAGFTVALLPSGGSWDLVTTYNRMSNPTYYMGNHQI